METTVSKKILVVEDDRNINMLIKIVLKHKKKDWELRGAHDGLEALEILGTYEADLVLIDLAMPKLNGVELIHKIKNNSALSRCKIAVLTATKDESLKASTRAAGIRDLWMKPITAELLFSNIDAMLQ